MLILKIIVLDQVILVKLQSYFISKRFMMKTVSKTGEKIAEKVLPCIVNKSYASYTVSHRESSQDNSKCGHPVVVKKSCDVENCNTTNCAEDANMCNNSSVTHAMVGHKTHSPKGAETNEAIETIIEVPTAKAHIGIYENTQKLNEATKNQKPLSTNEDPTKEVE